MKVKIKAQDLTEVIDTELLRSWLELGEGEIDIKIKNDIATIEVV